MPKVPEGRGITRESTLRINQAATARHLQIAADTPSSRVSSQKPKRGKKPYVHSTPSPDLVNGWENQGRGRIVEGYLQARRERKSTDQDNANNFIKRLTGEE